MKNIKLIRITKEYTQIKVEIDTGITQSTQSKYENGELVPTTEKLILLADYYNTSLDFLMDRTDERKPYPHKIEEK